MTLTKNKSWWVVGVFLIIMLLSPQSGADPGNIKYFYDKMLRLIKVQYEDNTTIEYAYDLLGNRQARTILVGGGSNNPPQVPSNPLPVNGATLVNPHHPALQWSGSDPDPGDSLFYDIYFGTDLDPPLFTSTSQPAVSDLGELDSSRTYYWKIVAKDSHNAVTQGPLWSFTTANDPPPAPENPVPANNSFIAPANAFLDWECGSDPNPDDNITFDIYFGTTQPLSLVQADYADHQYALGNLTSSTHYYWQIVSKDVHGAETPGPVWEFDTLNHGSTLLNSVTYTQNTTLTRAGGPYVVRGALTINAGVTLTIEPGTILKFEQQFSYKIEINGTLLAQGTEAQPIIFTSLLDDEYGGDTNNDGSSTLPQRNDWGGITFYTNSGSSSIMDHCVLKYGGGNSNGFICINQASPTIRNSWIGESNNSAIRISGQAIILNNQIVNNGYIGIMISSGSPEIRDNQFSGGRNYDIYISSGLNNNIKIIGNTIRNGIQCFGYGVQEITGNTVHYNRFYPFQIGCDNVGQFLSGNTIYAEPGNSLIVNGGTLAKDATWSDTFEYLIEGVVTVQGTDGADSITTLTLLPGAILHFKQSTRLNIGYQSGSPGRLIAQGSSTKKIIFTAYPGFDAPYWAGLSFFQTNASDSIMKNCIIEKATTTFYGQNTGLTISDSIIRDSTNYGIRVSNFQLIVQNTQIYNHLSTAIINEGILTTQLTNCVIRGNGGKGLEAIGGNVVVDDCSFYGNGNYDIVFGTYATGSVINSVFNSGLYLNTAGLSQISANTINYNSNLPVRIAADKVGELLANNTLNNINSASYLEVAGGTISKDATWTALIPYHILGSITVQGTDGGDAVTTLTLQPGAKLFFAQYTQLQIGSGAPGALSAQGTAANPILFTSNKPSPAAGDWNGFYFQDTTHDTITVLDYCTIEYAGLSINGRALYINSASPTISHCTIRYSQGDGIYMYAGSPMISYNTIANCGQYGINLYYSGTPTIANNTFSNNSKYDVYLNIGTNVAVNSNTFQKGIYVGSGSLGSFSGNSFIYNDTYPIRLHANDIGRLLTDNTISNVTANSFMEVTAGIISKDAAWTALMPYHFQGNITVQGTDGGDAITTLTLQPGSRLLFMQRYNLAVGAASGAPGALSAQGTAANPILFTSGKTPQAAGDWAGINFYDTASDSLSILEYCTIEYAGYGTNGYAVYVYSASPTLSHSTVRYSQGDGINVTSGSPLISYNTISNCGQYGINVGSGAVSITNNTFSNNTKYDLYLSNGNTAVINSNTVQKGLYVANGSLANLSGNSFTYNDSYPIRLHANDIGRLLTDNTISNVTANSYLDVAAGTISKDATWTALMPYRIRGSVTVQGTDGGDAITTLTIQPDTKLLFNQYTQLIIGAASGAPGALSAQGTAANPILFSSGKTPQAAGDWYGFQFNNTASDSLCILDYGTIEYAGYGAGGYAVYINSASPTLSHSTVRYSQGDGINVTSGSPMISYNTISNCGQYGINISSGTPSITNNTFSNNTKYDLYLSNGNTAIIDSNTVQKGLYVGNGCLGSLTGNSFTYNDTYPIRLHADNIGRLLTNNTISNVTANSYLEVTAGTIAKDATWTNLMPYRILGSIIVQGTDGGDAVTTLTIQPGAKLLFNQYTQLAIGASSGAQGALNAQGTSANPILFTSGKATPAAGDWYGIYFDNTTNDAGSIMDYCIVQYAGCGNCAAIIINQASPTIRNTIIRNNKYYGISVNNGSPIIQNCQFIANANYDLYYSGTVGGTVSGCIINNGIYFSGNGSINFSGNTINYNNNRPVRLNADDVGNFMSTSIIGNTTPDSYLDVVGGMIIRDAVWTNAIAYHIFGSITVQGTDGGDAVTTLTIQPGAKLLFSQYTKLIIGAGSGNPGALNAQGTGANPILFTSGKTPQAVGDWYGIIFYNTTYDAGTILDYCIVQYAGYGNYGAIDFDQASPTFSNSVITNSSTYGLYVSNGAPTIQNSLLNTNGNYDLFYSGNVGGTVNDCTINKGISLLANGIVSFSGTTVIYNNAYPLKAYPDNVSALLSGTTLLNLDVNSYLAVNGGTISHDAFWPAGIPYYIQGNIIVQGTDGADAITSLTVAPGALLLFYTGISLTVGASSGAPGALIAQGTFEDPIWFSSSKSTPAPGDWKGIRFDNTTDDATSILEYCSVDYGGYSNQGGIYILNASPTLRYNTITNNKYGIYVYSGNPVITHNNISNNLTYGLYKAAAPVLIARDNWWGNASGPYHPTANPAGTGNAVSNNVDFIPWITEIAAISSKTRFPNGLTRKKENLILSLWKIKDLFE